MEIHDPVSPRIDEVDPLSSLNHIQARCGQRLVQKPALVFIEQRPCLGIDVAALPCRARVAEIGVAFGVIRHAAMLSGWRPMGKRADMQA
jgi:hypothetical protein